MLTLTNVESDRKVARTSWQRVRLFLKSQGMRTFFRVLEYGSVSGMRHWHVLVDGPEFLDVGGLRYAWRENGETRRVHSAKVYERGGAVAYLLKYATKDLVGRDHRRRGWRSVSVSRNVWSDVELKQLLVSHRGGEKLECELAMDKRS